MTSDGALLSLIVDDDRALLVLAAWGALACQLSEIDNRDIVDLLVGISGLGENTVIAKLKTLRVARVLIDGGISEMADKMLQTRVQSRLGGKKK